MLRVLLITIFLLSIFVLYKTDYFSYPIEEVEIVSDDVNYNEKNITHVAKNLYNKDLLSLDINHIQKIVLSDNWIKDAEIKKIFPRKLQIKVIIYKPYAIYNKQVIAMDGAILDMTSSPKNLPIIIDHINNRNSAQSILLMVADHLNELDFKIRKLELFDSLVKIYTQKNILISDKKNLQLNLNRLVDSYDDLQKVFKKEIKSIDMRYSNGFAIK